MNKKILIGLVLLTLVGAMVCAQTINGVWRTSTGNVISFYDNKGVWNETGAAVWKEAEKRGVVGIGTTAVRNLRSTGNLTWTGQSMFINTPTYAITWINFSTTMNPNGQTMQVSQGDTQPTTWTKVQ